MSFALAVGSALRGLDLSHAVCAVGFACFGMNLVGVGADGNPCTPVYTYANSESNSNTAESITNRLKKSLERFVHYFVFSTVTGKAVVAVR